MLDKLRRRRRAEDQDAEHDAARARVLDLLDELARLQREHPALAQDAEVRRRMTSIVLGGL